jgi:hypothetical protein
MARARRTRLSSRAFTPNTAANQASGHWLLIALGSSDDAEIHVMHRRIRVGPLAQGRELDPADATRAGRARIEQMAAGLTVATTPAKSAYPPVPNEEGSVQNQCKK